MGRTPLYLLVRNAIRNVFDLTVWIKKSRGPDFTGRGFCLAEKDR